MNPSQNICSCIDQEALSTASFQSEPILEYPTVGRSPKERSSRRRARKVAIRVMRQRNSVKVRDVEKETRGCAGFEDDDGDHIERKTKARLVLLF